MNVLIIRLSALGDVAMTLPVIYSVAESYREAEFCFLSLPFHEKLLIDPPANLRFIPVDTKGRHRGVRGLIRLFDELKGMGFTHVADLHHVLRSTIVTLLFRLFTPARTVTLDKGRREKQALTAQHQKQLEPLKTTFQRYEEVFTRLGFPPVVPFTPFYAEEKSHPTELCVGIAPFAKYEEKCYPAEQMKQVVEALSQHNGLHIYLFGGGIEEQGLLEEWENQYPCVTSTVGRQSLREELRLMARMRVMVTMDSANMHLASLVGTPVISVWGATHPYAGFYGWRQSPQNAVQSSLPCRPCSVFGNKPCWKQTLECMASIPPRSIVDKVLEYVG